MNTHKVTATKVTATMIVIVETEFSYNKDIDLIDQAHSALEHYFDNGDTEEFSDLKIKKIN